MISFVTERFPPLPVQSVRPVFVFWGRIHAQKGLDRALGIFSKVHAQQPSARFIVISPDGGDLNRIQNLVDVLGLGGAVQFMKGLDFSGIQQIARQASFYLQTSETEGMAMSVVESMQLGLVPVVSPVGEIANYARHGENAVVVTDDSAAVSDVMNLVDDDLRFQALRQRAIATWANQPIYKDSVVAACREILI